MTYSQIVYTTAISDGMPALLAQFIASQSAHETNGYTSNVFQNCSNCFGYKWVGQSSAQGPCTNSPEGNRYASYNSIEQSVHEMTAWIKRRQKEGKFPTDLHDVISLDQYAQLLKNSGFYGDTVSNYAARLSYWWDQIAMNILNIPPVVQKSAAGLLLVGVTAYLLRKRLFNKRRKL
jgi:flagellum-specific peptidoglycan hydrolase FlgJ